MAQTKGTRRDNRPTYVSAGNVLEDLGFSRSESLALKIKAELMDAILAEIERRAYTPKDLVCLLDDYQPQVSNLLRGKVSQFSIEKLLRYAETLRLRPMLTLRPPRGTSSATRATQRRARRVA